MYKIIRKSEAIIRRVSENKAVANFVTKETSPDVSLAVVENRGFFGEVTTENNRIYYILSGKLILEFGDDKKELNKGDSCFISRGSSYIMSGDCTAITVDQPAFG